MFELPLFPLNTVLFPGMPLNLHIFEERYKTMINECVAKREAFGVILIANNRSDTSHQAEPHEVGCTAQITQVQPLSEGRMNITAVGRERFRVLDLNHEKPYLSGTVETFPLTDLDAESVFVSAMHLRKQLEQYLAILQGAGQIQFDTSHLPNDPVAIAYLAAVLLKVSQEQKQDLLTVEKTSTILMKLRRIFRQEITLLKATSSPPENVDFNDRFSLS